MPKTIPIPCSKEEIDRLIEASIHDEFCFVLFTVAKTTGRRLGEYWTVKLKDIDFDKRVMVTQVLKRRKRVEREALLSDEVARVLRQYVVKNRLKLEEFVFRMISYRQIQRKVGEYATKAGITHNVTFHNFRHYFITELVRQGWSYDQIAKLTGHSSLGTLTHYDHAVASDLKAKAMDALRRM